MSRDALWGVIAIITVGLPACTDDAQEPADLVFTNAVVHTMDADNPRAEAIAIQGGRLVYVGSSEGAQAFIGDATAVEDLQGKAVLPGLHDAHTHLIWSSAELENVDLYSATTLDELLDAISVQAEMAPGEPWIRGSGWDVSLFDGTLDKGQLDGVIPDRPVFMGSSDGHSAWVNSEALALAGITGATPDPTGGIIERDGAGEPTGILREDAVSLVADLMPPFSEAQVDEGFTKAQAEASSYGITSIIDANVEGWMLDGYRRFEERGQLHVRVHGAIEVDPALGATQLSEIEALRGQHQTPLVKVNAVKLYLDGVIESKTAVMLEPYSDDGTNGTPNFTDEALDEVAIAVDKAGFQLHVHAIGDGAIRQILDSIERVIEVNGARDRRPLLAHLEVIHPDDIPRFSALGAYAVFQPLWSYPDSYITELTQPVIGPLRSEWLYPIGAVIEAGGTVAAGSDWSVSSMNPFEAMEVAITRQDPEDAEGVVLTPQHRVGIQAILAAYTVNGARAGFVEDELGTLTVGKRADLVVIDRDPFVIDPHTLSDVRVLRTLVDGREVHRAEGF
jgi:predicted amidohydrolase YtcJ